ncbi:hypothetical protein cypCar_00001704 [Cyprinus carpio]|nr:hypothetical protein cypCar_00001704 [Cyprinus carpio]
MIKCKSSKSSVSPKSPTKMAAGITRVPVSVKTGFVQDKSVPCSPTPPAVPETPDSLRSENPSDTSYENRSPVSRGLLTKGVRGKPSLMARKLMQLQRNSSLEPKDSFELKNGAFDGGSKQMLNGTIVHDIFQKAAMSSDFSPERIQTFAAEALRSPNYLGQIPSDGALSTQDATCSVTVTDYVDIEENMWCPRFGLKVKIDVTAGVRIHRRGRKPTERIVPLELKTGKESNSIEHRSQVILYTLMSSARRCDPEAGFLVYLKTGSLHPVVGNHMDRRELVKIRNSLAHHIGNSLVKVEGRSQMAPLPAIVSDKQACKYCPQKRNCAVYSRAVNPQAFVQSESEHLSPVHLQYFSHWLLLCTLEALTMENKAGRRIIWLQTAQQREKSGGCVGNMQLAREVSVLSDGVYKHSFVRKEGDQTLTGLIVGDRIVVSDQDSVLIGLATGYVTEITISGVTCSLDKNLSKFSSNTVFRLDQDEGLNKPQKQAMKKVLLSKDYTLIVGIPGTGKTTTICTLVRILHACGFSVLLTSYTHSAVDNILLKLKRFKISFLRLGRAQKVHHDILPFTEESL